MRDFCQPTEFSMFVKRHGNAHETETSSVPTNANTSTDSPSFAGPRVSSGNVGLAFGLVALASLFAMLGSLIPFVIPTKFATDPRFLSGSLGLAGGVLVFLALTDILTDAASQFKTTKLIDPIHATTISLGLFFVGILLYVGVKSITHSFHSKEEKTPIDNDSAISEDTTTSIPNHLRGNSIEIAVTLAYAFPLTLDFIISPKELFSLPLHCHLLHLEFSWRSVSYFTSSQKASS